MKNTTIEKVLDKIEQETEFSFLVMDKSINLHKKVDNIQADHENINPVLDRLFKDTDIAYRVIDRQIVLLPAATAATLQDNLQQDKRTVTGTVRDLAGEPVLGAIIVEKGTNNSAVSDADGKFAIKAVSGASAILVFSLLGFESVEMPVGTRTVIDAVLSEDTHLLDEVVVVGYGTQRKSTLTGAVSTIKSEKLTVAPITNITNTLGGQLPGLVTKQTSGWPGSDDASLIIRGAGSPLVIVDGVEANFSNLDPTQVESITILKDGSASIYGARAGNGVILVTTKRGIDSKPIITLNASLTMQGSTKRFPASSAGQRAEYFNEVHRNNGLPEAQIPFTDEEIQKFYNGTDPDYPNGDWFAETIRPWAPQQNHNLSVRGGSEKIKYYGYFGYNDQETIIRHDGGGYKRYNLQSNIDAKITDRITASVDFSMQYRNHLSPGDNSPNHENVWMSIYESDPRYATHLPDPEKLAYNNHFSGNTVYYCSTEIGGYINTTNVTFRSSGSLAYKFKYINGLEAKMFVNFNYGAGRTKQMYKSRDFYTYNYAADTYTRARSSLNPTSVEINDSFSPSLTQQYSLSYNNMFNKAHNVSAIVVYEAISSSSSSLYGYRERYKTSVIEELSAGDSETAKNSSSTSENGRASWITRLNYSYKDRYLFEGIFRADASARFAPGHRWGYFPSVSLGWVISQEQFMQSFGALDNLKLRVSEGQSGYDNIGNFDYLNTYGIDKNYIFGDETLTGLYQTRVANPNFTWETMTIYNAGLDFSFLNRKLYGTGEFFYRKREGILGTRTNSLPSSFGQIPPTENLNSQDTRGFELMLGTAGKAGDFSYDISGNISWSRSKWIKIDEPDYTDPDQKRISLRTGRWTDIRYGYVSDGLFTSQEEINALNYYYADLGSNANIRPGDIKYKNLNGDSKLDWRDMTIIGAGTTPHWMYGINTYFKYKNFDLSMLFQGAFGYTTYIRLDPRLTDYGFNHRWTEKNNDRNALLPRLASKAIDTSSSDFYNHNTSYIRLKNMAIGYDLPPGLLKKEGVEKLRIYVAGTNLFTLSTLNRYGVDPEMPEGSGYSYYPQQRTFSVGLNLSF